MRRFIACISTTLFLIPLLVLGAIHTLIYYMFHLSEAAFRWVEETDVKIRMWGRK